MSDAVHSARDRADDSSENTGRSDLVEVWGETVSLRNLGMALLISTPVTVVVFYVGRTVLQHLVSDPDRADTFSLLVGLVSVITCAVVCARLFAPQRILVDDDSVADSSSVDEALRELAEEEGGLGHVADLPPEVAQEMKDLGLYDAFARAEKKYGETA